MRQATAPEPSMASRRTITTRVRFADLSKRWYRVTWVTIFLLHAICLVFFGMLTWLYSQISHSYLQDCLRYYGLGMDGKYSLFIAGVHGVIAALHGISLLLMVGWSLWTRRWSLGPQQPSPVTERVWDENRKLKRSSSSRRHRLLFDVVSALSKDYEFLCGRRGVFGLESKYFDLIHLSREVAETALQTIQAYQMSSLLPRLWLNRLFVTLLVMNYWSTVLLSMLPVRSSMMRRALYMSCDMVLDFVSSVGVPIVLFASYAPQYDFSYAGFPSELWTNDVWFVNALNELPMVLIGSWYALFSRVFLSIGFLSCIESIKRIVREDESAHASLNQVASARSAPPMSAIAAAHPPPAKETTVIRLIRSRYRRFLKQSLHAIFVVGGVIVLALHLVAESKATLSDCAMQVRPWMNHDPACALILFSCYGTPSHHVNRTGHREDFATSFGDPDPNIVTRVLIRHCPALDVSPLIQRFPNLHAIKIYNSTIKAWDADAALTNTHHPSLGALFLVRVNTSDGRLPVGLLDADAPQQLTDIEIVVTNIFELPDDLDTKWVSGGTVMLERCALSVFPSVLARLAPYQLSVAMNALTAFPFETFSMSTGYYLNVGGNPISSLVPPVGAEEVSYAEGVAYLYLVDTNVSWLPSWLDPFLSKHEDRWGRVVIAHNTPLCARVLEVEALQSAAVAGTSGGDSESVLLSMQANITSVDRLVSDFIQCNEFDTLFYTLDYEDSISGIHDDADTSLFSFWN